MTVGIAGPQPVYQASGWQRATTVGQIVVILLFVAAAFLASWWVGLIVALAGAALATRLWVLILRPRTVLTAAGIEIRDGRNSVSVPWTDVQVCAAGFGGITIGCTDGRLVLARYPRKSNLARWLNRYTPADEVAAYFEQRGETARRSSGTA